MNHIHDWSMVEKRSDLETEFVNLWQRSTCHFECLYITIKVTADEQLISKTKIAAFEVEPLIVNVQT